MNHRIDALRKRLQHHNLDALLISSATHIRYLFGFTGSNAIALVTSDPVFLVTDRRYRQQAEEQVRDAEVLIAQHDLFSVLKDLPQMSTNIRVAVEANHLVVKHFTFLRRAFPAVRFLASENIIEKIASIKTPDEIEHIRQAGAICVQVFQKICGLLRVGMRELEVSAELSYQTMRAGSEGDPFEPIVASGLRSALPHGLSSNKQLQAGELVIIDFGATVNGYAADFTRTVMLGPKKPEHERMADAVQQAIEAAETAARPGVGGAQLDEIARNVLAEHGYSEYFQHSLGHGLGLNVHELPKVGQRSQESLEPGNVITLEPGVYIPEIGGIRIEDDFAVTTDGVENLTPFAREMPIVER